MSKISFSAVSHIGQLNEVNEDRVYANGRFSGSRELDRIQLSLEDSDKQFLFAVSDGMENLEEDSSPGISVSDELSKFHRKVHNSVKDMQYKLDELTGCVEQVNNLLYSLTVGNDSKKGKKPAVAGIIIDGGKAAAFNLGGCRAYKLEPENLRPLASDSKRTERLLKMGIITDEQAEMLSGQLGVPKSESISQVRKSEIFRLKEGDVLLICSNGLLEAVTEDTVFEILSADETTDEIAGLLVDEAVKNGARDNVTAAVIKVLAVEEDAAASKSASQSLTGRLNRLAGSVGGKKMDTARLASTLVFFVVVAAVLFGTYSLITSLTSHGTAKDASSKPQTESTIYESTNETGVEETTAVNGGEETQITESQPEEIGEAANTGSETDTKYTIKKGDSLFTISKKFYGDSQKYKLIMEANNIKDENKIAAGQEIIIPASK